MTLSCAAVPRNLMAFSTVPNFTANLQYSGFSCKFLAIGCICILAVASSMRTRSMKECSSPAFSSPTCCRFRSITIAASTWYSSPKRSTCRMAETALKPESVVSVFLFGGLSFGKPFALKTSCAVAFALIRLNAASSFLSRGLDCVNMSSSKSVCGLPTVDVLWQVPCTRCRFAGRNTVTSEPCPAGAPTCFISMPVSCNRPTMSCSIAFRVTPPSSVVEAVFEEEEEGNVCSTPW
mmetsp:Transcript_48149/g.112607  ORF Transcript_48149/g.112607 Transcript_48149/m.112607 type:complete len:236 (-) Transcript_48149:1501-2208(-)